MKRLVREFARALLSTSVLILILGGAYPLAVWGFGQLFFPAEANGSLIAHEGRLVGSSLIGQRFSDPSFFHPRPSLAGSGYDGTASGGSNWGPLSRQLSERVRRDLRSYREENGLSPEAAVPADAVTASASGLDPHISVENARLQASRIARARGIGTNEVRAVIEAVAEPRQLLVFGERRVNVLLLNLMLDKTRRSDERHE